MSYSVTYAPNAADSGAVPVDAGAYSALDPVTVAHNTGALARAGYLFSNWNTAADGSGFARSVGSVFNMPAANVTLYAQWIVASLVTVAQLKVFAKLGDSDDGDLQYQEFLSSAEQVVSDYLGYAPAAADYVHTFNGQGRSYLTLRSPVISITSITVAGVTKTLSDYVTDFETITNKNSEIFPVGALVVVTYRAGWSIIPALVTLCIKRIATLMSMETGERIGVSSQSFDGGNTRNFINYTSYAKYLAPLNSIRVDRIERMTP
jgi:uncharacterized repeat protein (TIGR02543 family)